MASPTMKETIVRLMPTCRISRISHVSGRRKKRAARPSRKNVTTNAVANAAKPKKIICRSAFVSGGTGVMEGEGSGYGWNFQDFSRVVKFMNRTVRAGV